MEWKPANALMNSRSFTDRRISINQLHQLYSIWMIFLSYLKLKFFRCTRVQFYSIEISENVYFHCEIWEVIRLIRASEIKMNVFNIVIRISLCITTIKCQHFYIVIIPFLWLFRAITKIADEISFVGLKIKFRTCEPVSLH